MLEAAEALEFEKTAKLRDRIKELKDLPELTTAPTADDIDAAMTSGGPMQAEQSNARARHNRAGNRN